MSRTPQRRRKPATPARRQTPGWSLFLAGFVCGGFAGFLGLLALAPAAPDPAKTTTAGQAQQETAAAESNDADDKPRYSFYTLLPESEVIVPEDERQPEQPAEPLVYFLQVGSFKHAEDADRQRAKLILMGLEADIQTVTVNSGDTWHRVVVGPFESHSNMASARATLVSNGIDTLLLKRKKSADAG